MYRWKSPSDSVRAPVARRRPPSPRLIALLAALLLAGCSGAALQKRPTPPAPSAQVAPEEEPKAVDVRDSRQTLTSLEAKDYLGDAACASCHQEAHRDHTGTRHSETLQKVTLETHGDAFRVGNTVRDKGRGLSYQTRVSDGKMLFSATDGKNQGELPADYAMGSGRNAITFFTEVDPKAYMKHRTSFYTQAKKWDFTPTLLETDPIQHPGGNIEAGAALEGCLLCHVTTLKKDLGKLNLAASQLGVGCERCHGPGRPHVMRIQGLGKDPEIERLGEASPDRINKICGACHRTSENADLRKPQVQRNLPRFQGLALEKSACYQKSNQLSCVTCHDPHKDSDPVLENSDRTCRSCHSSAPAQVLCKVNTQSGCTSCHMPAQRISSIPHVVYRNHWIKVWKDQKPIPGH
ncbi:MAG: multiheme c-type cytochrome [Armatimonadota bacterium]